MPSQHELLEVFQTDTMRFFGTVGDVEAYVCPNAAQAVNQHGGGGLPVHVEVAPDTNAFFFMDGLSDAFHNPGHILESKGAKWAGILRDADRFWRPAALQCCAGLIARPVRYCCHKLR